MSSGVDALVVVFEYNLLSASFLRAQGTKRESPNIS